MRSKPTVLQTILLVGTVLGCVLQHLAAPLHLARHDHVIAGAGGEHVHTHGPADHHGDDFAHASAPQHAHDDEPEHVPHPVEDHLERLTDGALPPAQVSLFAARAPSLAALRPPLARSALALDDANTCPRPPPPRGAASSRAPPIAS